MAIGSILYDIEDSLFCRAG